MCVLFAICTLRRRSEVRTHHVRTSPMHRQDFFAVAFPPFRPAAFFCAVVPPCDELLRELDEFDFFPPRLDEPEEFAIFAARSFDMPLSFNASYCFSFFTFELLPGMRHRLSVSSFGAVTSAHLQEQRVVPAPLVRFRDVVAARLRLLRIRHGRAVDFLVAVVLTWVFHILFAHEDRSSRRERTGTSRRRHRSRCRPRNRAEAR